MLKGRFEDGSDAPFIDGRILFPRLGRRGPVSFLVDTGADGTIILPTDGEKLGIDSGILINPTTSKGIGGTAVGFTERVVLSFSDGRYTYAYVLKIAIS